MRIFDEHGRRLPDVFIVGAAKSGTTSLYQMLLEHPKVFFPPSKKEPMYFCFGGEAPNPSLDQSFRDQAVSNQADYLELYTSAPADALAFDGTTAYLYKHEESVREMRACYGAHLRKAKIIAVLRNPIERAWSHYQYLIRNGFEALPFEEAIKPETIAKRSQQRWGFDYLGFGLYSKQLHTYMEAFEQVKVITTEELRTHEETLKAMFEFLGLPPVHISKPKQANPSGVPKNRYIVNQLRNNKLLKAGVNLLPETIKHNILQKRDKVMGKFLEKQSLHPDTRAWLANYYREDVAQLSELLGRDLTHWLKAPQKHA